MKLKLLTYKAATYRIMVEWVSKTSTINDPTMFIL